MTIKKAEERVEWINKHLADIDEKYWLNGALDLPVSKIKEYMKLRIEVDKLQTAIDIAKEREL